MKIVENLKCRLKYFYIKSITLILMILFLFQTSNSAQRFSREYGLIAKAEIDLKNCPTDKDAEAIVFFDIGKSYFVKEDGSYNVVFERKKRIKIFNESGLKFSEVEIPFYQEGGIHEKVYDIEAMVYNFEDGKIKKTLFDLKNVYEVKVNENWTVKKFALPQVKAGSIIEYKYKVASQYHFNLRDWEFQESIPVVYSKYVVEMIPFYEYTWLLQGASKFSYYKALHGRSRTFGQVNFNDKIHIYVMENLPAFKDEGFIASKDDYIVKIDFQLSKINYPSGGSRDIITTWPSLIKAMIKHNDFGKYANKAEGLAKKILNLNELTNNSDQEKFNNVLSYVKENYNWNNQSNEYASKSVNQFIKDKFGNSADINLFIVGLLNGVGIEAVPVIISTRNHGKIKYDYPFSHFFNYVLILANVDGKQVLTDATSPLNSNYSIPPMCINDKGLIVKKGEVMWVDLENGGQSKLSTSILIDSISDEMEVELMLNATKHEGYRLRNKFVGKDTEEIRVVLNQNSGYEIDKNSIAIKNLVQVEKPFILSYKVKYKTEKISDKIYFSPFLRETIEENPFKQNTRNYPIDMVYPIIKNYTSMIKIPKDYKLDYVSENYDIDNEFFSLNYASNINNNDQLQITFSYYFKKPVYSSKDYLKLKLYYNEIIKRANERVVLVKI